MVWYEDVNLVLTLVINTILLIVGLWRRGLLYPVAGIFLTVVMYNYYSQTYNIPLLFIGYIVGHLISLVRAIKANI